MTTPSDAPADRARTLLPKIAPLGGGAAACFAAGCEGAA